MVLLRAPSMHAQTGETGYDLIAAVNEYRVSQGKPPLTVDAALMAAAQGHAEWMAANHRPSHLGAGGSMPGDRAAAAGYSGGSVNVFENIAGGTLNYADVHFAVHVIWVQSTGHRLTMLKDATHIGGGTAWDTENQYFVLLIGGTGGTNSGASIFVDEPETPPVDPATPTPTPYYVTPIIRAEPNDEGTIIHTVEPGQTAWAIAAVYGVDLETMLALNGLQRPVILYPGDSITVQLGPDATPPAPIIRTHIVQANESAWTIAATYGLTLDQLLDINDLERPAILQPGQELIVQLPPGD